MPHAPTWGMSINKILSYVDLGHSSRKGVRLTAAIAENHRASVEVVLTEAKMPLYSTSIGGEPAFVAPGFSLRLLKSTQQAIDRRLLEAVNVLESENVEGEITTHRLEDSEVDGLIEYAQQSEADLIVMSCDEAGLFDRMFHRSFAEKLARTSSCPVMVIAGNTQVTAPLRNLLVATDYSENAMRAAYAARDIIGDDGTLTFLHVWPGFPDFTPAPDDVEARSPLGLANDVQLEKLQSWVRDLHFTDIKTKCHVAGGSPDEQIAGLADDIRADLIVVGSRPHDDWTEKLFGTVTDRLIETCGRPVLAVPKIASVSAPLSRLDRTLAQSFPASDPAAQWAGAPRE